MSFSKLNRDSRGAAYVEFLVAFLPVFVFFLCLLQLALLYVSKLMVEHAAVQSARAAAVVFGDAPGAYGESASDTNTITPNRAKAVRDAALLTLAPLVLDGSLADLRVAIPPADAPLGADQPIGSKLPPMSPAGPSMLRVRVEADVVCKIALANVIMCPGPGRTKTARAEALYPYQGASYAYEPE